MTIDTIFADKVSRGEFYKEKKRKQSTIFESIPTFYIGKRRSLQERRKQMTELREEQGICGGTKENVQQSLILSIKIMAVKPFLNILFKYGFHIANSP